MTGVQTCALPILSCYRIQVFYLEALHLVACMFSGKRILHRSTLDHFYRICVECTVSSFNYAHKININSTATFHEEINWIAWFRQYRERLSVHNLDILEYSRLSCDSTVYNKERKKEGKKERKEERKKEGERERERNKQTNK